MLGKPHNLVIDPICGYMKYFSLFNLPNKDLKTLPATVMSNTQSHHRLQSAGYKNVSNHILLTNVKK